MINKTISFFFLAVCLVGFVFADADLDSLNHLFDNPPPDQIADTTQKVGLEQINVKTTHYFGKLMTDAALITGFKTNETSLSNSLYYLGHLQGGVDARPIPEVRVYGVLSTFLPQGLNAKTATSLEQGSLNKVYPAPTETLNTSSIVSIDELFLDYTILNLAYLRAGKFSVTWGQGHLFNPGNLLDGIGDGVTIKAFIPMLGNGVTGVVIGRPSYFPNTSNPNIWEFGYAGSFETTLGFLSFGVSGFHQLQSGNTADAYVKTSFWGLDVFAEGTLSRPPDTDLQPGLYHPGLLTGIFWEGTPQRLKITAEYWINGSGVDFNDQKIGIGASCDPFPFIGLQPSARWLHSLRDQSGQVIFGLDSSPLPDMQITFGVPYTYGSSNTEFILNNSDPQGRWIAPGIRVSINIGF